MSERHFLFLQGPHGPFYYQLARQLRQAGAAVTRVGFNSGDRAFWPHRASYRAFTHPQDMWPAVLAQMIRADQITDIVLYGDTRPVHRGAIAVARALGIRIHVFEEGYMRPYWVSYERGGSNGNSDLMGISVAQMRAAQAEAAADMPEPPAHWGDMRQHIFYGALYHWFVLFRNRPYRHFVAHRAEPLFAETLRYTRRLLAMPLHAAERAAATARVKSGGYPFHMVLLQLDHDANFQQHSEFKDTPEFLRAVIAGFALGAPAHHHLVIKAHPLEAGRIPLRRCVQDLARQYGLARRVHFVRGGKLAQLLNHTRSAVTVNSTAGQQVLWRGIPLRALGRAVYGKPEFVSEQSLVAFFADPKRPDLEAYHAYRLFLLETSQITGGFYSRRGRRQLVRQLVDLMLADVDPYQARLAAGRRARNATKTSDMAGSAQQI